MNRIFSLPGLLLLLCSALHVTAQKQDSIHVLFVNAQIDQHVVAANIASLDTLYADDFVFSHGSGKIEGKAGWLSSVKKGSYISREHDSVHVELHPALAIVRGKLTVTKRTPDGADRYRIRYVRVYAHRKHHWQMISHVTVFEEHF